MSRKSGQRRQFVELEAMEGRQLYAAHPAFDLLYPSAGPYGAGHAMHVNVQMGGFERDTQVPVSVFLSADDVVGNGDDIPLGSQTATNVYVAPMDGYPELVTAVGTCDFDVTLPAGLVPGRYHLVATAPGAGSFVGEAIDVITPTDAPDVSVAPYATSPGLLKAGDDAQVLFKVTNTGTGAAGSVKVNVYYSKDDVAGNGDDFLVGSGAVRVGAFATNEYGDIHYTVPAVSGEYHPIVVVDPDDAIAEADETNNAAVWPAVTVGTARPDVSVASMTTDVAAGPGGTAVTVNLGLAVRGARPSSVRVAFYLSFDYNGVADAGNFEWATHTYDVPVGAGGTTQLAPVVLNLPDWVVPGTYHVTAQLDSYYAAVATNGNDILIGQGGTGDGRYIGPAVTILPYGSDVTAAGQVDGGGAVVAPGGTGSTSLTLTNDKAKASRGTYDVSFYLSDDATLSAGDRLFSKKAIKAAVPAHGEATVGLRYTLPKNARVGTQYLIAVATPHGPATGAGRAALKAAGQRAVAVSRITVAGPKLSAVVRSVRPVQGRAGVERVTVRLANSGLATFADAVTLKVLTDGDSPETLLTAKRVLNLKAGKHVDVTLTVAKRAAAGLRVVVS